MSPKDGVSIPYFTKIPEVGLGNEVMKIIDELSEAEPELGDPKSLGPMMSRPIKSSLYAFIKFLTRNLNDVEHFRVSGLILESLTRMLGNLLHEENAHGLPTYGGSESNLTSLYIAREMGFKYAIVPKSAHLSVIKSCRILGLKVIRAEVDRDLRVIPESVARASRKVKESVIVLTAGNTETGVIDNVKEVSELVPDKPIIVDAAFGGLIAPFIKNELPVFDFRVDNVVALGVDGHKAGLTPIPSGMLLIRGDEAYAKVVFKGMYLHSRKQIGLLWTRTAASVASLWASLVSLGKEGFRRIYSECMQLTNMLWEKLVSYGFEPTKPELPILCIRCRDVRGENLLKGLRRLGWYVYLCPSLNGVKVTIMPHVTKDTIEEFIEDLIKVSRRLTATPS